MPTPLDSFRRLRRTGTFAPRFYDKLLNSDSRIRDMFARTDFEKQHRLFEHGVHVLLEYAGGSAIGGMAMSRLGERHSQRDLDVDPALYDIWVDCLIATARELDPRWTSILERRFKADLKKGIERMKLAYHAQAD